jgi:hypothetical protein
VRLWGIPEGVMGDACAACCTRWHYSGLKLRCSLWRALTGSVGGNADACCTWLALLVRSLCRSTLYGKVADVWLRLHTRSRFVTESESERVESGAGRQRRRTDEYSGATWGEGGRRALSCTFFTKRFGSGCRSLGISERR